MSHHYHTPKTFAELTGFPLSAVKRGCKAYAERTQDYTGWGLLPPRRGEVPCMVAGSPRGNIRIIPLWVAERMSEVTQ